MSIASDLTRGTSCPNDNFDETAMDAVIYQDYVDPDVLKEFDSMVGADDIDNFDEGLCGITECLHCGNDPCWWSNKYQVALVIVDEMGEKYDYTTKNGIEAGKKYLFDLLDKDGCPVVGGGFPGCVLNGVNRLFPYIYPVPVGAKTSEKVVVSKTPQSVVVSKMPENVACTEMPEKVGVVQMSTKVDVAKISKKLSVVEMPKKVIFSKMPDKVSVVEMPKMLLRNCRKKLVLRK